MGEVTLKISADVSGAVQGTAQISENMDKINKETDAYRNRASDAFKNAATSAKTLAKAIDQNETQLKQLTQEYLKLASSSSKWTAADKKRFDELNKSIDKTKKDIGILKGLQSDLGATASKGTSIFKNLGATIVGAFTVGAVVNFAKAAAQAWNEQEQASKKLLVALKGNTDAQRILVNQANELQRTSLFPDEQIIQAQSMLAFLTKDEQIIKKLTPLVLDFAQAKGMDLASAADLVSKAIGSNVNALARYGIEVNGAVGSSERLNDVVNGLTNAFGGQAEEAAKTGTGGITQLSNAWGELMEGFGSGTGRMAGVLKWLSDFVYGLSEAFKTIEQIKQESLDESLAQAFKQDAEEIKVISLKLQESGMSVADADKRAKELMIESLIKLKAYNAGYYGEQSEQVKQVELQIKELTKVTTINAEKTKEQLEEENKARDELIKKLHDQFLLEEFQAGNRAKNLEMIKQSEIDAAKAAEEHAEGVRKLQTAFNELTDEFRDEAEVFDIPFNTEEVVKKYTELQQFIEDHPLFAKLGFENEEQIKQVKEYVGQLFDFAQQIVDQQVEATTRIVEDQNQRIEEQEELVNREFELKQEGLANNYQVEQENLAKMQKARDQAIKDREKAIKLQRSMSVVESGIALVASAANIIKGFSGIPIVGVALGLAAVAAMIAGFIAAQGKVKDATQMARGGQAGLLKGPRHSQGGIHIEAEGGEWFINRKSSMKYSPLLDAINKDDREGMRLFFDRKFINRMPQQKLFDIDKSKKLGEIARNTRKPGYDIQYGPGYIIERTGNYTKKINLN